MEPSEEIVEKAQKDTNFAPYYRDQMDTLRNRSPFILERMRKENYRALMIVFLAVLVIGFVRFVVAAMGDPNPDNRSARELQAP